MFFGVQKIYITFAPMMRSNCLKYRMWLCLLIIYINRGLFVAMPGIEISCSSKHEINSLLEIILNWAGGNNEIDEDGDAPEAYAAKTTQPMIDQNLTCACIKGPFAPAHKIFYQIDEAVNSSDYYGTIDQPPKQKKFEV